MDPVTNMREQLELARLIIAVSEDIEDHPERENVTVDDTNLRLAELVVALHESREWGGADPYLAPFSGLRRF